MLLTTNAAGALVHLLVAIHDPSVHTQGKVKEYEVRGAGHNRVA